MVLEMSLPNLCFVSWHIDKLLKSCTRRTQSLQGKICLHIVRLYSSKQQKLFFWAKGTMVAGTLNPGDPLPNEFPSHYKKYSTQCSSSILIFMELTRERDPSTVGQQKFQIQFLVRPGKTPVQILESHCQPMPITLMQMNSWSKRKVASSVLSTLIAPLSMYSHKFCVSHLLPELLFEVTAQSASFHSGKQCI